MTYHKLTIKNVDGKEYSWIYLDKEKLYKRFREYQVNAKNDIQAYPDSTLWQSDTTIHVSIVIKYHLKIVYSADWCVQVIEDLGFDG
jgi:hypothetical protein